MKSKKCYLSIIVPVYNEQGNLKKLYSKLKTVTSKLKKSSEIIFIDDGSTDESLNILKSLSDVKIVVFRKNFGQTAALAAGFQNARGQVVVALDADLQNDPKDIPKLIKKIEQGYDVVSGWRKNRKDPYLTRVLPSTIANKIISFVMGIPLNDYGCTLKAYRKQVLKNLKLYGETHRLIPAYAALSGAKITEVQVNHSPRQYGKSNYNLGRVFKILFDLLTVKFLHDFSTKPLYLFGTAGILVFSFGIVIFIFVAIRVIMFQGGWISPLILLSGLMVILGFQFILIGLLAELLVRIYYETSQKNPYEVKKTINF